MDMRDNLSLAGSAPSFFMQRTVAGPGPGQQPPIDNLSSSMLFGATSMTAQLDSTLAMSGHHGETAKRKRGRPRKYGPDGKLSSSLVSNSINSSHMHSSGRSPPAAKKPHLAPLGEWLSRSGGISFTPHVITATAGEDIASKIVDFSQQGPRCTCVLSAYGTVSRATLRHSSGSGPGASVTYEGRFEILCLSGSYLVANDVDPTNQPGGLSVSLSNPDCQILGGGVSGMLIAGGPVQVILGSFVWGGARAKAKKVDLIESSKELSHQGNSGLLSGNCQGFIPSSSSVTHVSGDLRNVGFDMYLKP